MVTPRTDCRDPAQGQGSGAGVGRICATRSDLKTCLEDIGNMAGSVMFVVGTQTRRLMMTGERVMTGL